jgi:Uma2 family endonuclease
MLATMVANDDRPKKPATYEDVLNAPEHFIAEVLDGELFLSPRPAPPHAQTTTTLTGILFSPLQEGIGGPGGWRFLFEPELHLGPDILVPDLGGWRRERLPRVPKAAFLTIAPDWACEVVSPSTGRIDRVKKLPIYAREGVSHVWLIEPLKRTLEVFRLTSGQLTLAKAYGNENVVRIEPFENFEFELSRIWPELEDNAQ